MKKLRYLYIALLCGFLLGIQDGYIALWRNNEPDPVRVFPCRVEFLPAADQEALRNGIHLDDRSRLLSLLEDYLS